MIDVRKYVRYNVINQNIERVIVLAIMTPTELRKDIYNAIKQVNTNGSPVIISGKKDDSSAVLVSLDDWNSIQETLSFLSNQENVETLHERENDEEVEYEDSLWDML